LNAAISKGVGLRVVVISDQEDGRGKREGKTKNPKKKEETVIKDSKKQ